MLRAGAAKTVAPTQEAIISFLRLMSIITIIPGLISFYSFYHFIFTRFLSRKKIWAAIGWGLFICVASGTLGFLALNFQ
jgi:hypothetical protein